MGKKPQNAALGRYLKDVLQKMPRLDSKNLEILISQEIKDSKLIQELVGLTKEQLSIAKKLFRDI